MAETVDAKRVSRSEDKYLLTAGQALELRGKLAAALTPDSHNGPAGYRVKSLYFDTPAGRDAWESEEGEYARQKLRLRLYDEEDALIHLEYKKKRDGRQRKYSLPVTRAQAEALCRGDFSLLLSAGDEEALEAYAVAAAGYRPAAIVAYRRLAFLWPHRATRITLDSDVRCHEGGHGLFDRALPLAPALPPGAVVLEVKYNGTLEPFLRELLRGYGTPRLAVSKYGEARRAAGYLL